MTVNEESQLPSSIRPYLNEIAERLWSGHAAIMVGAGFSKNSKRNSSTTKNFPDWSELGNLFYKKIHGRTPDPTQNYLNVLKLADELQAAFGRPALDQLLRSNIPDKDHDPSALHVELLTLPWTDVFTTNYDTLLERACSNVTSHKYDIVVNKEDLVYSEKPRIIKLHGSFPSERPFIITEEDYRKYPKLFAPFVNTVQQSLIENTLCLIGFSGDDPNFLQWIGWIRDNLGRSNSPKIFLIGIFNLSDAQKKLLEQRNIVLIDLSAFPDAAGNHTKALELFCDFLHSRKEDDNRLGWPGTQKLLHPDHQGADQVKELTEILQEWRRIRLSYPNWNILPEDRRDSLLVFTQHWLNFRLFNKELSPPSDIQYLYELNWRLERCLCPIYNDIIIKYEKILEKYNPFPELIKIEAAIVIKGDSKDKNIPWKSIQRKWFEIHFSILRFYREEGFLDKWKAVSDMLEKLRPKLSSHLIARLHYERCLFALFSLQLPNIRKQLTVWPINESLPFWETKRAGLLAEIGETEEAVKILENSLTFIRSQLNLSPITNDFSLVSQEAYVMLLLRYVKNSIGFMRGEFDDQEDMRRNFTERWNVLKQYNCDPWNELKLYEKKFAHEPSALPDVSKKYEFDIGRVTRTHHMRGINKEAQAAYSFLRYCEDAGFPFRVPGSSLAKESVNGALQRISTYSPSWALATLFRIGDSKIIDSIFNRESIYKMEISTADNFIHEYLQTLEVSRSEIEKSNSFHRDNFGVLLAKTIPEVLSRLCCKCSLEARNKLLDFLFQIYSSNHKDKYAGIRNLTRRLISTYSTEQQYRIIPKLLQFPILGTLPPIVRGEYPNPFGFLQISDFSAGDTSIKIENDIVKNLIRAANSKITEEREWAICTLIKLHNIGLIKKNYISKLAKALWSQTDTFGLPINTGFYKFAFLDLPRPTDINPTILIKEYFADEKIPIQSEKGTGISITGGSIPFLHEILGANKYIEWSEEEVVNIFNCLVDWWDKDKDYLKKDDKPGLLGSVANEFRARFRYLVDVLAEVVCPQLDININREIKNLLKRLMSELDAHVFPSLRLNASCIHIFPERKHETFSRVEKAMGSNDHGEIVDCLNAIFVIIRSAETVESNDKINTFIDLIGQQIKWRRMVGLVSTIKAIGEIVNEFPQHITSQFQQDVLSGLNYLTNETEIEHKKSDLAIPERLKIREESAYLAFTFFRYFSERGEQIPEEVIKWKNICSSRNEFAEIRNQWIERMYEH